MSFLLVVITPMGNNIAGPLPRFWCKASLTPGIKKGPGQLLNKVTGFWWRASTNRLL
jgi:hypothetical protein